MGKHVFPFSSSIRWVIHSMGTLDEWHAERFIYSVTYVNCKAVLLFGDKEGFVLGM